MVHPKPLPERRAGLAGLAAVAGVMAASSCCLPLFPFLAGAAMAGTSAFLSAARPYLIGASVLFLAFGFYQGRKARQCRRPPSLFSAVLLWVSAVFVGAALLFPQAMANAAANLLVRQTGPRPVRNLTTQNIASIGAAFDAARGDARVLVFFSPT